VPHARLLVVGADPPLSLRQAASERVVVTGYVPDVRPYLQRAAVYVVPLRIGGGTRVKALQAMAMQLPIVSTALGCEGLDLQPGRHALIADDAAAFADAVVRVLEDAALGAALAQEAAVHVRRFDWSRVGDRLEQVFIAAVRAPRRRPAPVLSYASDPH
jgi:glycosyltransferase involved in cell wall biosynthesis